MSRLCCTCSSAVHAAFLQGKLSTLLTQLCVLVCAGATAVVRAPGDRLISRSRGHCLAVGTVFAGANATTTPCTGGEEAPKGPCG
jgi:hypothetical protein